MVLLVVACGSMSVSAQVVGIPLSRTEERTESLRHHYGRRSANESVAVPIADRQTIQYFGPLYVGTPAQRLTVCYDSGSSDTWLPAAHCTGPCGGSGRYLPEQSTTAAAVVPTRTFSAGYGMGTVRGILTTDNLSLGGGLSANGTRFGLVTQELGGHWRGMVFDGIVGLAYPRLSHPGLVPLIDTLWFAGQLPAWEVSFALAGSDGRPHEMMVGGRNTGRFAVETLRWVPVTQRSWWTVGLVGASFADGRGLLPQWKTRTTLVDTGTSLICAPDAWIRAVHQRISVDQSCRGIETLPDLVLHLDAGVRLHIPAADYTVRFPDGTCMLAMQAIDSQDTVVLGDPVFRANWVAFDRAGNRVGFADYCGGSLARNCVRAST